MSDVMILNEPTAALRVVAILLPNVAPDYEWVVGDVKVSKAGAAFAVSNALPVAVGGGQPGSFQLQIAEAELDTLGKLRVQFNADFAFQDEVIIDVRAAASVDVAAVVAAIFAMIPDTDAPVGDRTFREQWNNQHAFDCGNGDGIDGPLFAIKSPGGKERITGTVRSGKRVFTKRDGT